MIQFDSFTLDNGLTVIANQDDKTPLVAVNLLYRVGAKNENPKATGFAHLFEHLMFSGSKNFQSYDEAIQMMGGESNAFTNNDFTNYYLTLPADFLPHALDLEADRMQNLNINVQSLEVQRNVVIEEFKQRYINQPYGDLWAEIRRLAYKVHPYKWQTIGSDISHIENASLEQVRSFYDNFYQPSNAILSISGNVSLNSVKEEVERAFGKMEYKRTIFPAYSMEPQQKDNRRIKVFRDVPSNVICIIFPMSRRKDRQYFVQDLLSDVLSNGKSSRMYQGLVVEQKLFTEINAFISGDDDAGLFIVMGKYCDGISLEQGEEAIWHELKSVCENPVSEQELRKMKNKNEASATFSNMKILDKAMNLAYYAHLGEPNRINKEREFYNNVTIRDLQQAAEQMFHFDCHSVLYYLKNDRNEIE
mgnify:CR=1 FL=1